MEYNAKVCICKLAYLQEKSGAFVLWKIKIYCGFKTPKGKTEGLKSIFNDENDQLEGHFTAN